jgi:uncharacterized transporter YbjL
MQGSRSNGMTLTMVGIVIVIAVLAIWLITDTLFQIGIIVGAGMFFGGLILTMMDKRKAA